MTFQAFPRMRIWSTELSLISTVGLRLLRPQQSGALLLVGGTSLISTVVGLRLVGFDDCKADGAAPAELP